VSLKDELLADQGPPERTPKRQQHPKGWEPGVVWNGRRGEVTTVAADEPSTWDDLIADWGLDPATVTVVPGSVQIRAWDTNLGDGDVQRLRYYRATLVERSPSTDADRVDVEALCQWVLKRKPVKPVKVETDTALVALASDWQMGKGEGDGTEGTVERVATATDGLVARLKELRRAGRPVSTLYLVGMGDLVEQCGGAGTGHYAMQTFSVDLDRREQMRVVRRLLLRAVDACAPHVERMVLAAVPGNHGENRDGTGKAFTTWTDNDDLAVVEQVAEVLAANPDRYGHVSTFLADGLTLTLDIAGVAVAFAHGHQAKGGSGHAAAKLEQWWKGQALGRTGVADAQILVTGHLHHLVVSEATGRTFMQCPAMDPGSAWWVAQQGASSQPGMLTFGVGTSYGPRGWGDLAVL
jgi:predicted phosphodiesterase